MIKLPRTLHIEGSRLPVGKGDPEAVQFTKLVGQFLVIEEKVDGTGVSIFFDEQLNFHICHRGSPASGKEFRPLYKWVELHQDELFDILDTRYILFGEWMLHLHTIFYDRFPHFFLESDIYDQQTGLWLSTMARNDLLSAHPFIRHVPVIASFKPSALSQITSLVGPSLYQSDGWRNDLWEMCEKKGQEFYKVLGSTDVADLAEGLYIKHEDDRQVVGRYKYVRYGFLETIINSGSHIMDREPIHNISNGGYSDLL